LRLLLVHTDADNEIMRVGGYAMPIEHTEPGVIFGRRVREVRMRHRAQRTDGLKWTQAELAERVTALGWPIDQAAIARLESEKPTTRAQNVRLAEVLAIAAALGVSPMFLFLPLDYNEEVKVGELRFPANHLWRWVRGEEQLRDDDDYRIFLTERDEVSLARINARRLSLTDDPAAAIAALEEAERETAEIEAEERAKEERRGKHR
jgi:transcriptional regulator with XRE-family HTH domain